MQTANTTSPAGNFKVLTKHHRHLAPRILIVLAVLPISVVPAMAEDLKTVKFIHSPALTGYAAAVVAPDQALVHTAQLFPTSDSGHLTATDVDSQTNWLLDQLDGALKTSGSQLSRCVKLNFCVSDSTARTAVVRILATRFPEQEQPAVSFVVSSLPVAGARVAVDAIATTEADSDSSVIRAPQSAILPPGTRIYVSGQAEQSDSLAEATRTTLDSLGKTLTFLGRSTKDIVQIKAFVMPMSDHDLVRREVAGFLGEQLRTPLVLVEWKSSARTPIEIELIAFGGPAERTRADSTPDPVEFLTPPGMTRPTIYSRVARINHGPTIFVSGLYAQDAAADPSSPANGEREVTEIFATFTDVLHEAGSDLRHLVKATYYVSTDAASSKLNELRPRYYDPLRPPAASKAVVVGVGREGLGLTIDMIAVPAALAAKNP